MAGMGKTGTVNIFPEMMDEAIKAIKDYRTIAFGDTDGNGSDGLYGTVKKEVETLTSSDFTGSASKGFVNFYTNNIEPATGSSPLFPTPKVLMNSLEQKTTSNTRGGYYHGRL